ncbi:hypothetical protein FAZ15_04595 [Sphingobacterium olei]|uniref:FAS1 domain-containing protein n=1 Tax=Sphingobacterium olei TaxID=2571155 RepID=A0A4U0P380_9SPHI|nr:fasciclin domain-containing protein [Sphingobacterium olei]TJZ61801.1 hypothetical protein FAZ15_04595 [Sphingobacterium olei]
MKNTLIYVIALLGISSFLQQCGDPWEDHINEGLTDINQSLIQRLENEAGASTFLSLLKEADLGVELDGTNSYTIFVPDNQSIGAIAAELRSDKGALSNFVKNHIAVSTHRLNTSADTIQLTMLNGKILDMLSSRIGEVSFLKSNQGSSDGLYHILAAPLMPQQNLWEYITAQQDYKQNQFLSSLSTYKLYDDGLLDSEEDSLLNNEFLHFVGDVRLEKDRFTYFVLQDVAFDKDVSAFLPYVNYRNEADSSIQISRYYVARDLIVRRAYNKEGLPSELTTMSGGKLVVDKSAIVESIQLSNGYVHVLDAALLDNTQGVTNKLASFKVEGEEPSSFSHSRPSNTFHRDRQDPNGLLFRDIMVQNHGVSMFTINYRLPHFLSTSYDVYWRALNDIQANVFQQRLRILGEEYPGVLGAPTRDEMYLSPYTDVPLMNYDEVYVGSFELSEFQQVMAQLMAAASTANGVNTVVLDYLRFVPKVK